MKSIKLFAMLALGSVLCAQEKDNRFSLYGEAASVDFQQTFVTLDANYRLADQWSLSSWNQRSIQRPTNFGGNFTSSATTINYKRKSTNTTVSVGYVHFKDSYSTIDGVMFKLRIKII